MKDMNHIITPWWDDYTLCWYANDEFEIVHLWWEAEDIESIREFYNKNYEEKIEYWSNCKSCIKILRKLRSIKK